MLAFRIVKVQKYKLAVRNDSNLTRKITHLRVFRTKKRLVFDYANLRGGANFFFGAKFKFSFFFFFGFNS